MDFYRDGKIHRPAVLWISQCNCGETFVEETEQKLLFASQAHSVVCREWIPTTTLIGAYITQEVVAE